MPLVDLTKKAAQILNESRYTVVLTGAGISTESGIPDFRSPGTGLWEKEDPEDFTIDSFERNPRVFFQRIYPLLDLIQKATSNRGHQVLAEMETSGIVRTVITQNVDGLHQGAGSKRVLEVHGTFRTGTCRFCRKKTDLSDLLFFMERGEGPDCPQCGGNIKPDVTLFGEAMPSDFQSALREAMKCDCMLVVGSSLQVAPVGYLPRYSKNLIIINKGTTPYDDMAKVVIRGSAGAALTLILEELQFLAQTKVT